ncbi:Flp pilus assembly protein CpaB [Bordetella bronchiseptica]|uniref:Flp pilus assembly protein CpaB n=1 Tax=Bordetella bronchiseptica TaxID=518 RepID=UPI00081CF86D|nr:Flp pilus assembly protein CpaB [Bordetella bronchiseptica]AOB27433.1 Flp pilus assembly protein CpaB [Bordetella bronchiseptica]AZW44747.1 Flp pilus assembly protein CpaB [Bordetella bronchiseptica]
MKARWRQGLRVLGGYAFALVAGSVAAWAAREHIQRRAQDIEQQARVPMIASLVAARDLEAGTPLHDQLVAVRDMPQAWLPAGALRPDDAVQLDGAVLRAPVKAGVALQAALLSYPEQAPALTEQLETGQGAITLPLQELPGLSAATRPGDLVDLYVSFTHRQRQLTMPLLAGSKVLALDPADVQGGASTITLRASAREVARLVAARQEGTLTAVLRRAGAQARGAARVSAPPTAREAADLPALLGMPRDAAPRAAVPVLYGDRLDAPAAAAPGDTEAAMP